MAKRKSSTKKSKPARDASEAYEPAPTSSEPRRDGLPVPGDVVLEICKFAHPRDVFHLSRTSKSLRADLTGRASASAWKQAFRNVEMPALPADLAGHRYAALAFEAICDHCYKRCKMLKDTLWDLRTRVCVKCSYKLVALADVPDSVHGLPSGQLRELLPTSKKPGFSYGKTSSLALRKVTDEIEEVVNDLAQLAQYVQTRKALVLALDAHARGVEDWNEKAVFAKQATDAVDKRRSEVCARLEAEGWKHLARTRTYIVEHPLVDQPRQLFDDDWADIKPRLTEAAIAWWNDTQALKREKLQRIQRYRRWVMAAKVLDRLESDGENDDNVWPDANDLRRMPELQPLLDGQLDPSSLQQQDSDLFRDEDIASSKRVSPASDSSEGSGDDDSMDQRGSDVDHYDDASIGSDQSMDDSFIAVTEDRSDPFVREISDEDANETQARSRRHTAHKQDDCAWCRVQRRNIKQVMKTCFADALQAWRHRIALELFDLIPVEVVQAAGVDVVSDDARLAFLSLATTVFRCEGVHDMNDSRCMCYGGEDQELTGFPAALRHRNVCMLDFGDRTEHLEDTSFTDSEYQEALRVYWTPENLTFDEDASDAVRDLVRQSGLDASNATRRDMDTADARFVCRSCESEGDTSKVSILGWWACVTTSFSTEFATTYSPDKKQNFHPHDHDAAWTRLTRTAEESVRTLAQRQVDKDEPRAVMLSELGMSFQELVDTQ